jgi:hypothetical protein
MATVIPAQSPGLAKTRQVPRAPLPASRCYLLRHGVTHHIRGHYPSFIAHMHSRARPKPSRRLQLSLIRRVFAGCCQSLLGDGPSRRYLRKSISGCLDPYPGGFLWCIYPLLPIETSAYSVRDGSAFPQYPVQRLQYGLSFRSCSHSFMFRPPDLFTTQVAPTAVTLSGLGSRGFYIRASHSSLPPRAPDMLVVRTGQLTTGDFHPIRLAALPAAPAHV